MWWLTWLYLQGTAVLRRAIARVAAAPLSREHAQGLVEYSLLLLMIAVVCIAVITLMGKNLSQLWYQKIIDAWPS
jgi:hypothetical protein